MSISIEELRETLKVNKNNMMNNSSLVNELIVDDLMIELGYNRKRDTSVKRLYDGIVDWEVINTDSDKKIKIAVKVFGLTDSSLDELSTDILNYCTDKRFSIIIKTNGELIDILRLNKEKLEYTKVTTINLSEELNDEQEDILEAISKNSFNMELIDNLLKSNGITYEEVLNVLINNSDILVNAISSVLSCSTEDITEHCAKIQATLANKDTNASVINSENSNNDSEQLIKANNLINELNAKIDELEQQLSEKDDEIASLSAENEIGATYSNNSDETDANNSNNKDVIEQYVQQIRELTKQLGDKTEEIETLNNKIIEQQKELDNLTDVDKKKALELLDIIEDIPDSERNYVAVINTELIQYNKLYTFVGQSLQKLYELKNFEASTYIFDGDLFKLVQPAQRNDLIMNNRAYDLDLENFNEDEVLNKLRIVFSHFNDIAFECKKIGTLTEEALQADVVEKQDRFSELAGPDEILDNSEFEDEQEENGIESTDNSQFSQGFNDNTQTDWETTNIETEENNKLTDNIFGTQEESFDNSFESFEQSGENFENFEQSGDSFEGFEETSSENNTDFELEGFDTEEEISDSLDEEPILLVQNLTNIDGLVWTEENVKFNNIKYVGGQEVTFAINLGTQDINYDNILCKCIDAILAIEAYNGNSSIITELKQKDFSFTNNSIKLYTEEYKNYPRINGTKYAIVNVSSVQQAATILVDICNALGINTDTKYVYLEAITDSKLIIESYSINEDSVQLLETDYFEAQDNDSKAVAIIRGDLFNHIIVTRNSLKAHEDIISNTTRVKTKYIDMPLASNDDVPTVIQKILEKGYENNIQINFNAIGNVIGEKYRIISPREDEVSPSHTNFIVGGTTMYCSNIEQWQIPHTLVKLHTSILNDTAIALQTQVNVNAINFYGSEFETTEPSLSLAIKSFVDYIASCVKQK